MRKAFCMTATVVLVVLTAVSIAGADTPQTIFYQGLLTDSVGAPLDTTVSMVFTIYDDSTASGSIWTETQICSPKDGRFDVLLGSIMPIHDTVFSDPERYLGIQVGSSPESPLS